MGVRSSQYRNVCNGPVGNCCGSLRICRAHLQNYRPGAVQVKNGQKTVGIEEILDVISQLEKGQQIIYICHNVRFARIRMRIILNDADRITESAMSGTKVFL